MTDNELLERLAAALARGAVPTHPPAASLQNLHRAIDAARTGGTPTRRPHRGPRPLTIAVAAGVLVIVSVAFVVAATSLRRIDGENATKATTTAVNSPELLEAQASSEALDDALERRDVVDVVAEVEKLRSLLTRLSPSDRAIIAVEAAALLERAERFVEQHALTDAAPTTNTSALPPTTERALLIPAATTPPTAATPTAVSSPSSPSDAPAMTAPGPTIDSDDNSGSNSGPGGGGSGQDGGDVDSVDDPDDNSGPGGGGDSGSGGGDGS